MRGGAQATDESMFVGKSIPCTCIQRVILIHKQPNPIANYHTERFMKTGVVPRQSTYEVRTIERAAEVGLDDLGLPANERANAAVVDA